MSREPLQTVGDGSLQRPRSIHTNLGVFLLLLVIIPHLVGCQSDNDLTLAFLGDLNLGRDVTPGFDSLAYLEEEFSKADLVAANLESPLGDGSGTTLGYNLCAPAANSVLLKAWGIDLLSLANNHARDCSSEGISETQSLLGEEGLVGLTSQPYQAEVKDTGITFFAFDDISSELDVEAAVALIASAHSHSSLVVVSLHWGMEYQGAPSDRQVTLAGVLAEAGADIIWGHHPHVLQKVDWLETTRGSTLILYSLGNALFDQGGLKDTRQSALVLVKIKDGKVIAMEAVPFEIDVPTSILVSPSIKSSEEILFRLAIPMALTPTR